MDILEKTLKSLSISRRSIPLSLSLPLQKLKQQKQQQKPSYYLLDISLQKKPGTGGGSGGGHFVAASCSDFSIRLHDARTLCIVGELTGHRQSVCGVRFSKEEGSSLLYSGSADGTVRGWDVRMVGGGRGHKDAQMEFKSDPSHSFLSFDVNSSSSLLCAGTEQIDGEDSFLVFWDVRKPGLLGVYSESHSDDITQVCFHPRDKDRVASGSTDGLVNIFDLQRGAEEDALTATLNTHSSAACVCWSGRDYTQLMCVSHDEGVNLWDLGRLDTEEPMVIYSTKDARRLQVLGESAGADEAKEEDKEEEEDGDILGDVFGGGANGVDYLVGGAWMEQAQKLLVVGGKSNKDGGPAGDLHLMECSGSSGLRLLNSLSDGHSATVRCFLLDEGSQSLYTGGEDAQLLLWKPGEEEEEGAGLKKESASSKLKSESALRVKSRPHKKHGYQKNKAKDSYR